MTAPPPRVLIPWIAGEAMTVAEAARLAHRSGKTVRGWAATHDIGRPVGGGTWMISRVALLMFLEGNTAALHDYLSGSRAGVVAEYFARAVENEPEKSA